MFLPTRAFQSLDVLPLSIPGHAVQHSLSPAPNQTPKSLLKSISTDFQPQSGDVPLASNPYRPPSAWNLLIARVFEGFWRRDIHVGGNGLVHKGPKTDAQVAGELAHLAGQRGAQVLDVPQIVLHGVGQVHQVVDVHRIVFHLTHLDLEDLGVICNMAGQRSERASPGRNKGGWSQDWGESQWDPTGSTGTQGDGLKLLGGDYHSETHQGVNHYEQGACM